MLTNVEDLEGAYKAAMQAEGSAYRENEAYLDSIQGRVDLFMNSLQTFWMNLISSDVAKWVVDTGTKLIQFLDTVPGKATAAAIGISALLKVTKGFDSIKAGLNMALGTDFKKSKLGTVIDSFKKDTSGITANTAATQANTSAKAANTSATNAETAADARQAAAANTAAEGNATQAAATQAAAAASAEATKATDAETAADARQATASNAAAAGNERQTLALQSTALVTTEATGAITALTIANTAQAGSSGAAGKAFSKLTGILKAHPFLTIAAAVGLAAAAIDKFTTTAQEASEKSHDKFNEIADVSDTTKSNISNLETELSTIDSQISDLEGRNLSFTDDQELKRLKSQRTALENNLSIQKQLLKSQEQVKSEAAINAMKDFVKASNEGAESAEKTGKAIGLATGAAVALGIALAPISGGTSLLASAAAATGANTIALGAGVTAGGAIIGGTVGGVAGSNINAATVSTYDDWYETYTNAYKEKSKAAADARKKYEKDPGDIDKYDEWQKLEQEATEVQSKMYDNLTQMQNYYSGIEYGQSDAMDKELDAWNNFLDKMNIEQNGVDAKVNALDRIFGENASDEVKEFRKEVEKVIKDGDNKFDIAAEIEGRDDLQELEDQLKEIGITTDEVSDYFRKTGEIGVEAFSDLSEEIAASQTATTQLQAALQKNTNEGYETRNTGLEEMKKLMEKGAIGSESNLWNIAEAMGFTYDSAKSIEANSDKLYDFIKVRDDWYQVDENGEWGVSGAKAFAEDIEKAVQNSKALQDLDIKWSFDESTGSLDFDFNNMQFDDIVKALADTKEAAGLTNEEFIDMLTHIGQFYDVQWASGNDILSYLEYLKTTGISAKSQLEAVKKPLEQLLGKQDLNPKEIEDYLTGNGSLKELPEDLQSAVTAYRKLRDEAKKPVETQEINKTSKTKEKTSFIDKVKNLFASYKSKEVVSDKEKQGGKLGGALSALSILSMLGIGALSKRKKGKFRDPTSFINDKGLSKHSPKLLGYSGSFSKGKGLFSSLFGKGKGLFSSLFGKGSLKGLAGLLGKGGFKGAFGALSKGAFKIGSKFLGPIGWAASAATTIIPLLTKQFGKGKGLFSSLLGGSRKSQFKASSNSFGNKGLFNFSGKSKGGIGLLGKGASKILSKAGLLGLGFGAVGAATPWLTKKITGKAKPDNISAKLPDKKVGLNAKVDKNTDKLSTFTDNAKELSKLDKNIKVDVTANVDGNVTEEFEYKLNNLKTFADSAKGLKDIGNVTSNVTANVNGNVIDTFEYKINNLKTFADGAKDISSVGKNVEASVKANVDGNVIDTFEYKINNLKTFSDSAKELNKLDKNIEVNVKANVDGNVTDKFEYKVNNLETFANGAKELNKLDKNIEVNVKANVDGNVTDKFEYKVNNLETFADSAKELNGLDKNIEVNVKASVDGDVIDKFEYKINNLETFADSAKELNELDKNIEVNVEANVNGNVTDKFEYKVNNLETFANGAKELNKLDKNIEVNVKANVDGNVTDKFEYKVNNLETFADSAKELNGLDKNIEVNVKASVDGNILDNDDKVSKLKKFGNIASELASISKIVIRVSAKVATKAINNALSLLQKVKDSGLFKNYKASVTVQAKVNSTEVDGYQPGEKIGTAKYQVDSSKVDSWKPPVKESTIKYAPSIEALTYNQTHKKGTITYTPKIKGDGLGVNGTAHVKGTAFAYGTAFKQGDWRTKKEVTALTGELGQELVIPPSGDRWYTVGDNGAEFAHIPKGSIIFNHKQTEELFKNGKVTSGGGRGKVFANGTAYAEGTAYASGSGTIKKYTFSYNSKTGSISKTSKSSKSKKSKKSGKNGESDFEEVFDWFEVKIEEINEDLDLMAAKIENVVSLTTKKGNGKNDILNDMIRTNKSELKALDKGYKLYNAYANRLLKQKNKKGNYIIPKKYWDEAKNGKIAIEEFYGKVDEKTLEQIKNYREWAQKAADVNKQIQEVKRTITELAKQKFDNIAELYDNIAALQDNRQQHYLDMADLRDDQGEINSGKYYEAAISEEEKQKNSLTKEKKRLQASLNNSVKKGNIKKYSAEWYDMVNQIHEVDSQIDECIANIEDYQNRINEIHFDNFEKKVSRITRIADETQDLIDIMADKDDVTTNANGDVEWTDEGVTKLGLYAQKMEEAKVESQLYADEIDYLNAHYKDMGMSYQEYLDKLDELKDGQFNAIKSYNDSKNAIVDLQKARIDEVKNGIEKQIEAYQELIDKKKEELSTEKDLYDFQESVLEQKQSLSDINRQLAALAGDNSASARAQRKKLEAERAKAEKELQDSYYDRSVEKQQEALDNEFEQFQELKQKEMEELDKWLEDVDEVFEDAVKTVKASGTSIKATIQDVSKEWDIQINKHIKDPWNNAANALTDTETALKGVLAAFDEIVKKVNETAEAQINTQKDQNENIIEEKKDKFSAGQTVSAKKGTQAYKTNNTNDKLFKLGYDVNSYKVVSVDNQTGLTKVKNTKGKIRYIKTSDLQLSSNTNNKKNNNNKNNTTKYPYGKASETSGLIKYGDKGTAVKAIQYALKKLGYSIGSSGIDGSFGPATKAAVQKFQKNMGILANGIVGKDTRAKFRYKGYAKGTKKINKDQLALVDELGPELQLVAGKSGRLEYITRGSSIIPSDISENLMKLGQLDPSEILQHSKPSIGINPSVHNTEINLNVQYGDMLKIENFNGDDPEEVAKIVAKQFEKHTRDLNASLRKYVR